MDNMDKTRLLTPIELMSDERERTIDRVVKMLVEQHGYSIGSVIIKDILKLKELD